MDEEYDVVVCGTGRDLALSIIECKNPKLRVPSGTFLLEQT